MYAANKVYISGKSGAFIVIPNVIFQANPNSAAEGDGNRIHHELSISDSSDTPK
jgi:hypothetical protein